MTRPFDVTTLRPGDVLLYGPRGLFGWAIALKTWHPIAHVEVAVDPGFSVASRDGVGIGRYPLRTQDLAYVRRPVLPFDLAAALRWFTTVAGEPYGWLDLLQFVGLPINATGMVCSPFATRFLRAGGIPLFGNEEPAEKIAPMEFLVTELLATLWRSDHVAPSVEVRR